MRQAIGVQGGRCTGWSKK